MTRQREHFSDHKPDQAAAKEAGFIVAYFISAGCVYKSLPPALVMLPYSNGRLLRHFWRQARSAVRKMIPLRAFQLMDQEFAPGKPSRNFDSWPKEPRRELYALCVPTGCNVHMDDHGNVMPLCVRSMATYLEDLRAARDASD